VHRITAHGQGDVNRFGIHARSLDTISLQPLTLQPKRVVSARLMRGE
jgi:hypothetical protein